MFVKKIMISMLEELTGSYLYDTHLERCYLGPDYIPERQKLLE